MEGNTRLSAPEQAQRARLQLQELLRQSVMDAHAADARRRQSRRGPESSNSSGAVTYSLSPATFATRHVANTHADTERDRTAFGSESAGRSVRSHTRTERTSPAYSLELGTPLHHSVGNSRSDAGTESPSPERREALMLMQVDEEHEEAELMQTLRDEEEKNSATDAEDAEEEEEEEEEEEDDGDDDDDGDGYGIDHGHRNARADGNVRNGNVRDGDLDSRQHEAGAVHTKRPPLQAHATSRRQYTIASDTTQMPRHMGHSAGAPSAVTTSSASVSVPGPSRRAPFTGYEDTTSRALAQLAVQDGHTACTSHGDEQEQGTRRDYSGMVGSSGVAAANGTNAASAAAATAAPFVEVGTAVKREGFEQLGLAPTTDSSKVTSLEAQGRGLVTVPLVVATFKFLHLADLSNNHLTALPEAICTLPHLHQLNVSHNRLETLPAEIGKMRRLVQLDLSMNALRDLPAPLAHCSTLQTLYLSGNSLSRVPAAVLSLPDLRRLYLGSNAIRRLPSAIKSLTRLSVLYLGGNLLRSLPPEICRLQELRVLYLGDNRLTDLPRCINKLHKLNTLNLHKNQLRALPPSVVEMRSLQQLSLRGNPLVTSFALEATRSPLSLQELCARTIKNHSIPYCPKCVPPVLCDYLDSAQRCSNPSCKGVYFTQGVKDIQFVDFCGKYRVPLLKYLCSPCHTEPKVPREEMQQTRHKVRRVLLDTYEDPCEHITQDKSAGAGGR